MHRDTRERWSGRILNATGGPGGANSPGEVDCPPRGEAARGEAPRLVGAAPAPDETGTAVLDAPETADPEPLWHVILFNDEVHTFDEVEFQLQKATGCSQEVAGHVAITAHREGQAVAFQGTRADCEQVASILGEIELDVAVEPGN